MQIGGVPARRYEKAISRSQKVGRGQGANQKSKEGAPKEKQATYHQRIAQLVSSGTV